ncbi:hypothetical protein AK812_SmicGene26967 [Symbiodinium microadriaticum]|uniref:Uncharacterized protein n=1 Tax=Symbiodinium microadriaticum TaxID=2951 RepID=A0A1Q9D881_SYMMI|nr:hypothetical protein AK812_SmicGene26967 [Symbiodinium microadriaticum]
MRCQKCPPGHAWKGPAANTGDMVRLTPGLQVKWGKMLAVCEDLVVPVGTELMPQCVLFLPNLADATGQEVSVDDHRGVSVFKAT